jgi:hypothetical protein
MKCFMTKQQCMAATALILGFGLTSLWMTAAFGAAEDPLSQGFVNPPAEAKLRTWWWWGEGPKGKDSLKADLEAMKRNEIAGVTIIDARFEGWSLVTKGSAGARFMSEEWREQFRYALAEASRLGIEVTVNLASGWNAGGPWMPLELSPKRVTFASVELTGPLACDQVLPRGAGDLYTDLRVLAIPLGENGALSAVDRLGNKTGWNRKNRVPEVDLDRPDDHCVKKEEIIDLTDRLDAAGRLKWSVPEGRWQLLRIGYSAFNDYRSKTKYSSAGGSGYECDPLDRKAVKFHFENMAAVLAKDAGALAGKTLKYFHVDSWEQIACNWTGGFAGEFERRRGYSPWPYLPVLAGILVDSRSTSDRFLHDFRLTVSDLIADNYYGYFRELSNRLGVKFTAESGQSCYQWDQLKAGGAVDLPMGEVWMQAFGQPVTDSVQAVKRWGYSRPATSAAHIYGSRFSAIEQFTSSRHWLEGLDELKPVADITWGHGANRLVWHQYSHSALERGRPGDVYFAGTQFNRNVTWWDDGIAFSRYIARSQYLLSRGLSVADILCFYGENVPTRIHDFNKADFDKWTAAGFGYDVIGRDALLTRAGVKDGRIVLPDGMSYSVLALAGGETMSLEVLEKIESLVGQGATLVGPPPLEPCGLGGGVTEAGKFKTLVSKLWDGKPDGLPLSKRYGKGRVVWGPVKDGIFRTRVMPVISADWALNTLSNDGVKPDFSFSSGQTGAAISYTHRRDGETEIYFVYNSNPRAESLRCAFRVAGKQPELWDPVTLRVCLPAADEAEGGLTTLPLRLDPYGSVFVVFRPRTSVPGSVSVMLAGQKGPADAEIVLDNKRQLALEAAAPGNYEVHVAGKAKHRVEFTPGWAAFELNGPWELSFPAGWGAPEHATFEKLIPWNSSEVEGIKYFSGTAAYTKEFDLPAKLTCGVMLDLGKVEELAHVWVNEKDMGILWTAPYRVDITSAVKPGKNRLKILVTNTWANRWTGDRKLPEEKRFTRTNVIGLGGGFGKDELMESGLMGPVSVAPVYRSAISLD